MDYENWKVLSQIGEGAFATVMRAVHKTTGHTVALKIYEKKKLTDKVHMMALHREIYVLSGIDHKNMNFQYHTTTHENKP